MVFTTGFTIAYATSAYHHQIIFKAMKMGVRFIVFNIAFNNISVILLRSIVLLKETGVPTENH
jgi:hypothetical protein